MNHKLYEQFKHPASEFTPFPFWFWNDALTEEELARQIDDFDAKGVNGFVIHPRMGLAEDIVYLSDRYMHFVRFAVERAAARGMKVILYDEAAYPSGSAHGMVVASDPDLASKGLCMLKGDAPAGETAVAVLWVLAEDGNIISVSERVQDGYEKYSFVQRFSHGTIRGIHYGEDDGQPGAPLSSDILSRSATARFIELTHETYYRWLKDYFGTTVIGFFCDEPAILGRVYDRGLIAWTDGFLSHYLSMGGQNTDLPYLFFGGDDTISARYKKAVNAMLRQNFYAVLSTWCEDHGIVLTGHPEKSDDIGLLAHFGMPCQDIVWRYIEPGNKTALVGEHSTMGKCAADSARHRGKRRCGNEVLGCCGPKEDLWGLTFSDMMWYFNWLFVRGNNLIIPHAFFYSVREKRRDERPPDVGPHSPWWEDYHHISDYIKRMCALNTDCVNTAEVAVLCREDGLSWKAVKPLYEHQIAFNYLEAELLPQAQIGETISIAAQKYSVLLLDSGIRLTNEETELLRQFTGTVVAYRCATTGLTDTVSVENDDALLAAVTAHTTKNGFTDCGAKSLRVSHQQKAGSDYFILFNEGEETLTIPCLYGGEIWDPWDASVTSVSDVLTLAGRQLLVLVCR